MIWHIFDSCKRIKSEKPALYSMEVLNPLKHRFFISLLSFPLNRNERENKSGEFKMTHQAPTNKRSLFLDKVPLCFVSQASILVL